MSRETLSESDRVAYTPQKPIWLLGSLSKNPKLSTSGRTANPSICQALILLFTLKPSKLTRTLGPSRMSINRPEPYSSSSLPA